MTNLFYAPKLLCLDSSLPAFLWSGDCQNETTGWAITPSRFVRPRHGSSPSYFSQFPRSMVAARRGAGGGHFKTGKYCPKKPCWKEASPADKKKPKTNQPFSFSLETLLCIKSHPKAWGKWKTDLWKSWRWHSTPASARCEGHTSALDELLGLGSAVLGMKGAVASQYVDVIAKEGCYKMLPNV